MKDQSMTGKPKGRSQYDHQLICNLIDRIEKLKVAVIPLVNIANAYHENALDDDARKTWGANDEFTNNTKPDRIELYSGRGGRQLLTLHDCLFAAEVVEGTA